jgi:hypothetical protein
VAGVLVAGVISEECIPFPKLWAVSVIASNKYTSLELQIKASMH